MTDSVSDVRNNAMPLQIVIIDDHPAVLLGLSNMLVEEGFHVVATFRNGKALQENMAGLDPQVFLMDLRMPGMTSTECIGLIQSAFPNAAILAISSYELDQEIFRSLDAGASGFLSKDATQEEVVRAIRRVSRGTRYLPPNIARVLQERNEQDNLTPRELEILQAVARGDTSKEIATHLNLSEFTVRNHVNNVLSKLRVRDRTEATVVALKRGLIILDEL